MAGPRFAPDLSKAQAGILVLDRGEYEFKCGTPKPFFYIKDDGTEVAGARVPVELVGMIGAEGSAEPTENDGKMASPVRLYVHTPKSFGMTKQFIMAVMGYVTEDEDRANEEYFNGADFSIDVDDPDAEDPTAIAGASWADLQGKIVRMRADVSQYKGRPSQDYKAYMPS